MSIKITTTSREFEAEVYKALAYDANKQLKKNFQQIEPRVKLIVAEQMAKSPFLQALVGGGDLRGELGLVAGTESRAVESIKTSVMRTVEVKANYWNDRLQRGGIVVNVQPADMANLLGLDVGKIRTYSKKYGNYELHWLDWVLTRGDETIVANYEYNPATGLGRSRIGNMKKGDSWSVPAEYSGNVDDNFVSRVLQAQETVTRINAVLYLALTE